VFSVTLSPLKGTDTHLQKDGLSTVCIHELYLEFYACKYTSINVCKRFDVLLTITRNFTFKNMLNCKNCNEIFNFI
jgi:hypothetical protein